MGTPSRKVLEMLGEGEIDVDQAEGLLEPISRSPAEEATTILGMLEEGEIDVDQAQRLLDALARSSTPRDATPRDATPRIATGRGRRRSTSRLTGEDVGGLALIGATPAYVRRLRELGLGDLSVDEIGALAVAGVTPEDAADLLVLRTDDGDAADDA